MNFKRTEAFSSGSLKVCCQSILLCIKAMACVPANSLQISNTSGPAITDSRTTRHIFGEMTTNLNTNPRRPSQRLT